MSEHFEIIEAVANGKGNALRQLYDIFSANVFNTAISYVQNQEDAEEVLQDVFVKIHKSAAKFEGKSSASTWIYRITVNTSLNYIKKKKRFSFLQVGIFKTDVPTFEHPGLILENQENGKIIFRVINQLPSKQKTAFILSFVEELPRQEVANIMEISLKATESLLQRAKANLRVKLNSFYPHRRKKK